MTSFSSPLLASESFALEALALSAVALGLTTFFATGAFFTGALAFTGLGELLSAADVSADFPSLRAEAAAARALAWFLASDLFSAPPGSYLVFSTEMVLP